MKIGILVTSISNFGQKGFYNSQEIGLAKELSKFFDYVEIFKLVDRSQEKSVEFIDGFRNIKISILPAKNIGINGILNLNDLYTNIDVLLYFSDTQLVVPTVFRWAKKNNILLIPYIGATKSKSKSKLKEKVINHLFKRNVQVYKKCKCLVKNLDVQEDLKKYGLLNIDIAPVGLDTTVLKTNFMDYSICELKKIWGYHSNSRILIFVGRLVPEKNPIKLIDLFERLYSDDNAYQLIIVGDGPLKEELDVRINSSRAKEHIKTINKIPNSDIWQLYYISDYFLNLCREEIFGMAILESMYYKCIVLAFPAPGPNYIIESKKDGFICSNINEIYKVINKTNNNDLIAERAHKKIVEEFTWKRTAEIIYQKSK